MSEYEIVTDESGVRRAPVPPSLITVTRVVYALHALSILIGVFTGASIATALCIRLAVDYCPLLSIMWNDLTLGVPIWTVISPGRSEHSGMRFCGLFSSGFSACCWLFS